MLNPTPDHITIHISYKWDGIQKCLHKLKSFAICLVYILRAWVNITVTIWLSPFENFAFWFFFKNWKMDSVSYMLISYTLMLHQFWGFYMIIHPLNYRYSDYHCHWNVISMQNITLKRFAIFDFLKWEKNWCLILHFIYFSSKPYNFQKHKALP